MDENFKDKLIKLLTLFKNRPNHLAKFLIDNSAFNKPFINRVLKSKLEIDDNLYIDSLSNMDDIYNYILDDIKSSKTDEEIETELNLKMVELINSERYEEAAKLRDYMSKNLIKRNNKK
jgi:hypothetical protein